MAETDPDARPLALGAALARLPLESPVHSAWPMLAQRLGGAPRRSRWPLALAAALLGLMVLPRGLPPAPTTSSLTAAGRATATVVGNGDAGASQRVKLAGLMAESARLERLVAAASDDGASSASTAALSLELEDRLHTLDSELEASRDLQKQLPLWQRRVQLLRNVATVEASRHYLAAEGRNLDVALVAAY